MKAQAAFEYMLVAMIVLAFLVPLWAYTTVVNNQAADELSISYAKNAVESIASAADLVYSQGAPAKMSINVYIPPSIEDSDIVNSTLILHVRNGGGVTDVYATSRAKINGTLPVSSANYLMEIEAIDDASYDVNIRRL